MAVETLGPLSVLSFSFLVDVGRKISERTGEPLEVQFLFQRIGVLVQRFNSVLFHKRTHVERTRCTQAADPRPRERINYPYGDRMK